MAENSWSGPENLRTLLLSVLWCILCFQRITFLRTYLTLLQLVIGLCGSGRISPCPSLECRFYFLVLWDHGFHSETLKLLAGFPHNRENGKSPGIRYWSFTAIKSPGISTFGDLSRELSGKNLQSRPSTTP